MSLKEGLKEGQHHSSTSRPAISASVPSASASAVAAASKQPRVLACVLCQQRKVKCDRRFPCVNCIKANAQCVPATLIPRQRRRRFPERDLLERLRYYESLLRKHKIDFEPLHPPAPTDVHADVNEDSPERGSPAEGPGSKKRPDLQSESLPESEACFEVRNIWDALTQTVDIPNTIDYESDGYDDDVELPQGAVRQYVIKKSWDQLHLTGDDMLFGSPQANVDLSTLHPTQVQVFRLWQIYLENIDPLLKVTHTPTLQVRILDAASEMQNVSPALEALMFSIYCVAIHSIADEDCRNFFGSSRRELMTCYRFGCQQALLNSRVLRSDDPDCLTALYLYLVATKHETDPRLTSSMLGVAIRVALRMGIHTEVTYKHFTPLDAEMRRRLWWSLIIFDNRICEMFDYKSTNLTPAWDCKCPINANDSELRTEMKTAPATHERPTEAIFAVLRCEVSDFMRRSAFHLDFSNPYLKRIHPDTRLNLALEASGLHALDESLEQKYLQYCNPENPLHLMTLWTTRAYLAKLHVLEHVWRYSGPSPPTDAQREAIIPYALTMLECDSNLMSSPLTKRYTWYTQSYFPFLAYMHVLQDLRTRPISTYSDIVWTALSAHYDARFSGGDPNENPLFKLVDRVVSQAWEAREALVENPPLEIPRIVQNLRLAMLQTFPAPRTSNNAAMTATSSDRHTSNSPPFDPSSSTSSHYAPADILDMLNLQHPVALNIAAFGQPYSLHSQLHHPLLAATAVGANVSSQGLIPNPFADPTAAQPPPAAGPHLTQTTPADPMDFTQVDWNAVDWSVLGTGAGGPSEGQSW